MRLMLVYGETLDDWSAIDFRREKLILWYLWK